MTFQEKQAELKRQHILEAKRLLILFSKDQALIFCKEVAEKLPKINDTPPVHRKSEDNYAQFYLGGVTHELNNMP
jgi:hypothetical protein